MYLGHKEMVRDFQQSDGRNVSDEDQTSQAWQLKLRSRPILTSIIGGTRMDRTNPHYPRLKPQPVAMSMIIRKRRLAAGRRYSRFLKLTEMRDEIKSEEKFERLGEQSLLKNMNEERKKGKDRRAHV